METRNRPTGTGREAERDKGGIKGEGPSPFKFLLQSPYFKL